MLMFFYKFTSFGGANLTPHEQALLLSDVKIFTLIF